ncbi:helix-turn-helix domain-containing protein [Hydrogenophaga taeniospiralis]|uniref:IclR family transcriptional regulator n=1 Tax=Hydrogenophaga TaxID=47420 RepID=UPI001CFAC759|nr:MULTISPECIES: helix-turn-helix domain-containing protein [Hydrogenophaga]MCB4365516.1 helix-turn-helix domain-containing protein [Hydrogenophaga taeniospiralis]UJW83076.1 helix-turn-helix domain-containing protein [Hydrogenophaga sp. SL48]
MNLALLALEQPASGSDRAGTQSLGRGIKLMRMIAARPEFGWRLSDLAAACHQDKATVHRMLACMVDERLVEQRASDRHYLPGPLMYELGLALPERTQFHLKAEVAVQAFARRMAGISLLLLRSGNEYVCSVRAGSLPLSGLMVHPGTRRPLFTSVGGVAILQTLPEREVREVLLDNVAQEVARRGAGRLEALQKMRERSDRHGFGVNLGDVVPGLHAFSVPVRDGRGEAFAALCLMGTAELYGEDRLALLRDELQAVAGKLSTEAATFNL